jgi:hypothetical protein
MAMAMSMRTDNTAPASGAAGGSAGPAGGPSSAYHASTGGAAGGGSVSGTSPDTVSSILDGYLSGMVQDGSLDSGYITRLRADHTLRRVVESSHGVAWADIREAITAAVQTIQEEEEDRQRGMDDW